MHCPALVRCHFPYSIDETPGDTSTRGLRHVHSKPEALSHRNAAGESMKFVVTTIVIAALAGIGAYFSWANNKMLSVILAFVTLIAGLIGMIGAFVLAVAGIFKILPILLFILGVWLVFRNVKSNDEVV